MLLLVIATAYSSPAQSADQLLRETAKNYQTLTGHQLSGHADVTISGSVWQTTVDFIFIGPSQSKSPDSGLPRTTPTGVSTGNFRSVKTALDAHQSKPDITVPGELFGRLDEIADSVVNVQRAGSDSLILNGARVTCDILKVTYTPSTYEHQHPKIVTYWIDPAKHFVLKETLTFSAGPHIDQALWTIAVDTAKSDQPTPRWMIDASNTPEVKDRTEGSGKAAPEFALPAADGSLVKL